MLSSSAPSLQQPLCGVARIWGTGSYPKVGVLWDTLLLAWAGTWHWGRRSPVTWSPARIGVQQEPLGGADKSPMEGPAPSPQSEVHPGRVPGSQIQGAPAE